MTKVIGWLWGNGSLGAYLVGVVYYNEIKPPDFKISWNSLSLKKYANNPLIDPRNNHD